MPRYYFPTDDGDHLHLDDVGQELPDREAARLVAQDALPDLARDKIPDGEDRVFRVDVRDDSDEVIYRVRLTLKGEWIKR